MIYLSAQELVDFKQNLSTTSNVILLPSFVSLHLHFTTDQTEKSLQSCCKHGTNFPLSATHFICFTSSPGLWLTGSYCSPSPLTSIPYSLSLIGSSLSSSLLLSHSPTLSYLLPFPLIWCSCLSFSPSLLWCPGVFLFFLWPLDLSLSSECVRVGVGYCWCFCHKFDNLMSTPDCIKFIISFFQSFNLTEKEERRKKPKINLFHTA